jgi:hypothetical protein
VKYLTSKAGTQVDAVSVNCIRGMSVGIFELFWKIAREPLDVRPDGQTRQQLKGSLSG